MIKRDGFGCVGQHNPDMPTYLDFGDSAAKTGIMALLGDGLSQYIIHLFVTKEGLGVRYPFVQGGNLFPNNPNNFTRDQLIQLLGGLYASDRSEIARKLLYTHVKRGFLCQNTHNLEGIKKAWWDRDILTLSHIGHLIKASKFYLLYPLLPFCWMWLLLDFLFSIYITPFEEQNQIISMLCVAGKPWIKLYKRLHPDYKKAIHIYWSGYPFRDQKEIAEKLINYLESIT